MPKPRPLSLADVRALALALPDTIEKPSYGTPGFRAKDKLFARVLPEGDRVIVRTEMDARDALLEARPAIFSLTPHYEGHPWVIVSLRTVGRTLLRELLEEARDLVAPPGKPSAAKKRSK